NYFTGIRWGNSERLTAVIIPKVGNPYIVTPAFEEDRTREQLTGGPMEHTDVAIWQEDESPFERVAQGLKDRGIATGRLGVEETAKFVFADSIASVAPALHVTSATPVTAGCRMIKDAHELELMGIACDATLKCYEAVFKALQAARAGVPLESIDAAARKVIVDAGYGPGFKYFTHRVGHGMGMDGHEWPYLVKNNMFGWDKALTMKPGMVFSDEPGVYIRGEFGVRLEDDMHVTDSGAELFTPQSPSIENPFGASS